jgi:thiamine kinase-like enzyme
MVSVAETARQAGATAKAFARFTAAFDDFNVKQLKKVIPGFHDLVARFEQFEAATQGEAYERLGKALPLIDELKKRERYKHFYEIITESEEFPVRVMHHDAKIANVLFSRKNGRVICPVDFDTIMPGYFFSDLGDMIRSMACSLDENSTDFDKIAIRKDFYESIVSNYMAVMEKHFSPAERKYVHYAGLLVVYMQAMRFLTDHLNGDIYYRITYPEQNFDRAKNQLVLLQRLEEFLGKEYEFVV